MTIRPLGWGLVGAALLIGASPALAVASTTPRGLPTCHPCTVEYRHDATGILTTSNGEPVVAPSPSASPTPVPGNPPSSAVVVVGNGVEVTLPDALAKAGYTVPVTPTLLAAIARLEYKTWQLNPSTVALPSLNLTLDYNGSDAGGFTTLVYEPYQDGRAIHPNQWQTWDALRGGNAKWWSTRALAALPGNGQQASPQPWSDILAAYPNAVMVAYGLNFGKGSPGAHARWNALTVGTIDWCKTTIWSAASPSPSPSVTASPSATPTSTPVDTPPPTTAGPTPTRTPSPTFVDTPSPGDTNNPPPGAGGLGNGPGSLAKTGFPVVPVVGASLIVLGAGALLLAVGHLRRRRVTA
jgi:hypothetical protein